MRGVKGSIDRSSAVLKLVELKASLVPSFEPDFDGCELPDVDLDALCDAIFADLNNGLAPQFFR
jgi:hypothetical protein